MTPVQATEHAVAILRAVTSNLVELTPEFAESDREALAGTALLAANAAARIVDQLERLPRPAPVTGSAALPDEAYARLDVPGVASMAKALSALRKPKGATSRPLAT